MCKLVHEVSKSRDAMQIMQIRQKVKVSAAPTAVCDMHAKRQCSDLIIITIAA